MEKLTKESLLKYIQRGEELIKEHNQKMSDRDLPGYVLDNCEFISLITMNAALRAPLRQGNEM